MVLVLTLPTKEKSITRLCEQLTNEHEKCQSIEMKLTKVENQLQEKLNIREETAARLEESQRTFEKRLDKQIEEKCFVMVKTTTFESKL